MEKFFDLIQARFSGVGINTLGWISTIIGHCIFVPSSLAILTGLTDRTPGLDIVVLVQAMLLIGFIRSILVRDNIASVLHGLGWFGQSLLLALIVFK